jgi:thiol:disulfide interchange protein DsbD
LAFGLLACGSPQTSEIIAFQPYDPAVLYRARQEGRPVLLEFYAEWCIPCRELEEFTFSDRGVISSTWPFVRVRVDMTDYESAESERLREQFGVTGVPEIHFLDPLGDEIQEARVIGFLGPEDFLRRVERALQPSSRKNFPSVPG